MHAPTGTRTPTTRTRLLLLLVATAALVVICLAFAAGGSRLSSVSAAPRTSWTPTPTSSTVKLWSNQNVYAVDNHGTSPQVLLRVDCYITEIWTYHWNYGHGAEPGTIALQDIKGGYTFGPWDAMGTDGQGGVPNANWVCKPQMVIPAGTYTIVDSDPETWSQNSQSGGFGMTWAYGWEYTAPTTSPTPSPTPTPTPTKTSTPSPTHADADPHPDPDTHDHPDARRPVHRLADAAVGHQPDAARRDGRRRLPQLGRGRGRHDRDHEQRRPVVEPAELRDDSRTARRVLPRQRRRRAGQRHHRESRLGRG